MESEGIVPSLLTTHRMAVPADLSMGKDLQIPIE
jgi:hypothetical protein